MNKITNGVKHFKCIFSTYLLGVRETVCFVKHRRSRDHKTYCFPDGPVNKCFINISSVEVNNSIKKIKTVFIEQSDTK